MTSSFDIYRYHLNCCPLFQADLPIPTVPSFWRRLLTTVRVYKSHPKEDSCYHLAQSTIKSKQKNINYKILHTGQVGSYLQNGTRHPQHHWRSFDGGEGGGTDCGSCRGPSQADNTGHSPAHSTLLLLLTPIRADPSTAAQLRSPIRRARSPAAARRNQPSHSFGNFRSASRDCRPRRTHTALFLQFPPASRTADAADVAENFTLSTARRHAFRSVCCAVIQPGFLSITGVLLPSRNSRPRGSTIHGDLSFRA